MSVRGGRQPIEVHVDPVQFVFTDTRIDEVLKILKALQRQGEHVSAELDRVAAEVAENTSVVGSAVALIDGLAQQIRDLADDPAALNALADELDASSNSLAAKVAENTPPPPEPEP